MRNSFINELRKHAEINNNIILLIGDLGFGAVEPFMDAHPKRFFNLGIAEQNMAGAAAGLAAAGKHVFTYSIGNFPTFRCAEQLRNDVDYHNLSVTTVSVGAGVSYGALGYSHHTIQDYALMRSFPNTLIFAPCDPIETKMCLEYLISNPQPSYLRLGKTGETVLSQVVELSVGKPNMISQTGKRHLILSTGTFLQNHYDQLSKTHDIFTVPIWGQKANTTAIEKLIMQYDSCKVGEDHLKAGGFFSWLCENLRDRNLVSKLTSMSYSNQIVGAVGSRDFLDEHYCTV